MDLAVILTGYHLKPKVASLILSVHIYLNFSAFQDFSGVCLCASLLIMQELFKT